LTKKERKEKRVKRKKRFFKGFGAYSAAALGVFVARWWGPYRAGLLTTAMFLNMEFVIEVAGAAVGGVIVMAIRHARGRKKANLTWERFVEWAFDSFLAGVAIDTLISGL